VRRDDGIADDGAAVDGAARAADPAARAAVDVDVAALLELAREAATRAGDLVRRGRPGRVVVAATKSSPTDVVTQMDRDSEELVRGLVRRHRPDDGFLGEEEGLTAGTSGLTWVVDPIDGTVNYLYGVPAYAVSVAVVRGDPRVTGGWQPLAGCVVDAAGGEVWTAALGAGARLDGQRLRAPDPPDLSGALLGTGFGYQAHRRRAQARVLADLLPRVRDVRRIGCAALDLCSVASGRLDAYYERGLHVWDMAAALLVATESGVRVVGPRGGPPGDELVVAARPPLVDVLGRELDRLGAASDDPVG
jgi:myo-inositol-1(or 4)-monophosphatase